AGTLKSIKRLRDGSFLVECGKRAQAQNLLQTNRFIDRPVKVSIRKTLNSSRGVIRCRDLADMPEVEIRDELRDQGVVGVNRVTMKKDGVLVDVEGFSHPRRSSPSSRPQVPPKPKVPDRQSKAERDLVLSNQYSALSDDEMESSSVLQS
ncbi:MAG: hypothetical protein LGB69_08390, partial [Sulfurovum sp.]|nr:hypothetical protein [Sulfurovum sp.]